MKEETIRALLVAIKYKYCSFSEAVCVAGNERRLNLCLSHSSTHVVLRPSAPLSFFSAYHVGHDYVYRPVQGVPRAGSTQARRGAAGGRRRGPLWPYQGRCLVRVVTSTWPGGFEASQARCVVVRTKRVLCPGKHSAKFVLGEAPPSRLKKGGRTRLFPAMHSDVL